MEEATEKEMIDGCERYACVECHLRPRCSMCKAIEDFINNNVEWWEEK